MVFHVSKLEFIGTVYWSRFDPQAPELLFIYDGRSCRFSSLFWQNISILDEIKELTRTLGGSTEMGHL